MRRLQFATKTADESVNNSAVLQNDNHLSFYGEAGKKYHVALALIIVATVDAMDVKLSMPSGATFKGQTRDIDASPVNALWDGSEKAIAELDGTVLAEGVVQMGTTAGTVVLQYAQNSATVGNTTMKAGSTLLATRVTTG